MAAAPQYGTIVFKTDSGKAIAIDVYHSDVANGLVNFDGGGGASATSPLYWIAPERGRIIDYMIVTGMTDTTKIRWQFNGVPTNSCSRFTSHLTTLAFRPPLSMGMNAGTRLTAVQLA